MTAKKGRDNSKIRAAFTVTGRTAARRPGDNEDRQCFECPGTDAMPRTQRSAIVSAPERLRLSPQTGGVATAISVPDVINCAAARTRCLEQLKDLLNRDVQVALRPTGTVPGESAPLYEFCRLLGSGLRHAAGTGNKLEFTIDAGEVPPNAALYLARHVLGAGVLNVMIDASSFSRWRDWLWRTRLDPHRRIASWPLVQSACSLLATEAAGDVLPQSGLQVPVQSAWVLGRLSLERYATRTREVDVDALDADLDRLLTAADELHDGVSWPTPAMRQDAWLNRRVAIRLEGVGDLAAALGLDPGRHETLRRLDGVLLRCREVLVNRSRGLAAASETLPAITAASPCRDRGTAWESRWLEAVRRSATRHRNLLALSPHAFFPGGVADYRYTNLLPLLSRADVCASSAAAPLQGWNINKFTSFHVHLGAIMAGLSTGYVVAEQH
jgi:hypothetical protein